MTEAAAGSLSIRACRLEDIERVLELWRQADATPGVTDTPDDLRRAIAESPAHVLVAEVENPTLVELRTEKAPSEIEGFVAEWARVNGVAVHAEQVRQEPLLLPPPVPRHHP